jgi:hypothetical protein
MSKSWEPTSGHVLVSVDPKQNKEVIISGKKLLTQKQYNVNYREKSPVVCKVEIGLGDIKEGMFLVCNYSHFDEDSPWLMEGGRFSIPVNNSIYGYIDDEGVLHPLCGNVFVTRLLKDHDIYIPADFEKPQINHGHVGVSGEGWEAGQEIFWYNYSDYEIVYTWKGVERRTIKVENDEIVGFMKK